MVSANSVNLQSTRRTMETRDVPTALHSVLLLSDQPYSHSAYVAQVTLVQTAGPALRVGRASTSQPRTHKHALTVLRTQLLLPPARQSQTVSVTLATPALSQVLPTRALRARKASTNQAPAPMPVPRALTRLHPLPPAQPSPTVNASQATQEPSPLRPTHAQHACLILTNPTPAPMHALNALITATLSLLPPPSVSACAMPGGWASMATAKHAPSTTSAMVGPTRKTAQSIVSAHKIVTLWMIARVCLVIKNLNKFIFYGGH